MFVRLTKLSGHKSVEWSVHVFGGELPNLPDGYVAEGELAGPLEPGQRILVRRTRRSDVNGDIVDADGLFTSSPIKSVREYSGYSLVTTENSTYKVEALS